MTTKFEHAYVLSVMADDHPGIVAAVSKAVSDLGGNIDACSQTVLSGFFTLILIASFPAPMETEALASAAGGGTATGLQAMARRFEPPSRPADQRAECFVITAFGKDKPGIVRKFTQYLAGKDINIIDLYGDLDGEDFVLISQVEIPARWEIAMLQADLEQIGGEEGFTVRLQHEGIFVATNHLRLTPRH